MKIQNGGTYKNNSQDAWRDGLCEKTRDKATEIGKIYGKINGKINCKIAIEARKRKIYQIDKLTNKIIREFLSIREASKELNIHNGHIGEVCKGKLKTARRI